MALCGTTSPETLMVWIPAFADMMRRAESFALRGNDNGAPKDAVACDVVGLDPGFRRDDDPARPLPHRGSGPDRHFTPCISFCTSGAITNSSTPGITSAQKPNV